MLSSQTKELIAATMIHFQIIDLFTARIKVLIPNLHDSYCLMTRLCPAVVFRLSRSFTLRHMSRSLNSHSIDPIKNL